MAWRPGARPQKARGPDLTAHVRPEFSIARGCDIGRGRTPDIPEDVWAAGRDLQRRSREALAEWVSSWGLDTISTLTYRPGRLPGSPGAAWRDYQVWAEALGVGRGIVAIEYGRYHGRLHLHCLTDVGPAAGWADPRWVMRSLWSSRNGFAPVERARAGGAARYVAKYVTKQVGPEPLLRFWPDDFPAPELWPPLPEPGQDQD
jgi:hypothetical protein